MINAENISRYDQDGFDLLDGVFPAGIGEMVYDEFSNASWDQRHEQVRKDHYKHVFATDSEYMPGGDEVYQARFSRSSDLEKSATLSNAIDEHIRPMMCQYTGKQIKDIEIRCIAMKPGDFMRLHIDDYMGKIGFIYYANKKWGLDWGGLLSIARDDSLIVIPPRFNRMAVVSHTIGRVPHFVTQIAEYAFEPRFAIAAFCS